MKKLVFIIITLLTLSGCTITTKTIIVSPNDNEQAWSKSQVFLYRNGGIKVVSDYIILGKFSDITREKEGASYLYTVTLLDNLIDDYLKYIKVGTVRQLPVELKKNEPYDPYKKEPVYRPHGR